MGGLVIIFFPLLLIVSFVPGSMTLGTRDVVPEKKTFCVPFGIAPFLRRLYLYARFITTCRMLPFAKYLTRELDKEAFTNFTNFLVILRQFQEVRISFGVKYCLFKLKPSIAAFISMTYCLFWCFPVSWDASFEGHLKKSTTFVAVVCGSEELVHTGFAHTLGGAIHAPFVEA